MTCPHCGNDHPRMFTQMWTLTEPGARRSGQLCDVCARPFEVTERLTRVHVAGELVDGKQCCSRCQRVLLDLVDRPHEASSLWGFGLGRLVAEGPRGLYLITVSRPLARDEQLCVETP